MPAGGMTCKRVTRMADSAEADLAAGEGEEGARPSSRWARLRPGRRVGYTLVALAALVVIALTIAWFSRERIADDVIQGQLDQYNLPATYDIESIGPNRQVLRNIVVGDPADPDLTVARAIVDLRVRPWGTRFGRVTLEKPRLKGTLGDALHAVLCGCGHNIRMILAHLRALWAEIVAAIYAMFGTKRAPIAAQTGLRSLTA